MYTTTDYRSMNPARAADALAEQLGREQARDDAREAYCAEQLATKLSEYAKRPGGDLRDHTESLWTLFAERQCEHCDPLEQPLSRMLAAIANMSDDAINALRTASCDVADAALLVRDDIHNLFLDEAGGEFDSRKPQEPDYD